MHLTLSTLPLPEGPILVLTGSELPEREGYGSTTDTIREALRRARDLLDDAAESTATISRDALDVMVRALARKERQPNPIPLATRQAQLRQAIAAGPPATKRTRGGNDPT